MRWMGLTALHFIAFLGSSCVSHNARFSAAPQTTASPWRRLPGSRRCLTGRHDDLRTGDSVAVLLPCRGWRALVCSATVSAESLEVLADSETDLPLLQERETWRSRAEARCILPSAAREGGSRSLRTVSAWWQVQEIDNIFILKMLNKVKNWI